MRCSRQISQILYTCASHASHAAARPIWSRWCYARTTKETCTNQLEQTTILPRAPTSVRYSLMAPSDYIGRYLLCISNVGGRECQKYAISSVNDDSRMGYAWPQRHAKPPPPTRKTKTQIQFFKSRKESERRLERSVKISWTHAVPLSLVNSRWQDKYIHKVP